MIGTVDMSKKVCVYETYNSVLSMWFCLSSIVLVKCKMGRFFVVKDVAVYVLVRTRGRSWKSVERNWGYAQRSAIDLYRKLWSLCCNKWACCLLKCVFYHEHNAFIVRICEITFLGMSETKNQGWRARVWVRWWSERLGQFLGEF